MGVVCYVDHVVRVDCTERGKTVTHDGEECDEDIIDNINDIVLPRAERYPTNQEQHPCSAEECDQRCVERDEKAEC
jgi:hypothetical protein